MRRTRPARSSAAMPRSAVPALLATIVRSVAPCCTSACSSTVGTPDSPNPPTRTVAPSWTPATASRAVATRLSITLRVLSAGAAGRGRR